MGTFMGDPCSELTVALGMVLDHAGPMSVLGKRCKRFSMLVDTGIFKTLNVAEAEGDPAGDGNPTVSPVEKMLVENLGRAGIWCKMSLSALRKRIVSEVRECPSFSFGCHWEELIR